MTTTKAILYGTTADDFVFPVTISNDSNLLITQSNIVPTNGQVLLTSPEGVAIQADSVPLATADPQNRAGWYYKNAGKGGEKFNWYFYDGTKHGYTVADVRMITATVSLTNPLLKPFFVLYTKSGSHRTYQTSELLIEGEKVIFYFGESGYIPQNNDQLRLIRLVASHDDGLVLPEMEVQFLTMHSDSAFASGAFEMCCENVGFRIINITCNYSLATPVSGGSGPSSDVNVISTVETPVTNGALSNMTFNGNGLMVSAVLEGFGDKGILMPVNITECDVVLGVSNKALSDMSFYNSGVGGNLLKVVLPEITNVHIMGQEVDLNVSVVGTVPISNDSLTNMTFTDTNLRCNIYNFPATQKISLPNSIACSTLNESSFDGWISGEPLAEGSTSPVYSLTNFNKIMVWGSGDKATGAPRLVLQCANNDNIEYYDTLYNLDITTIGVFGTINENLPVVYARLIVRGGTINQLNVKVSYK